MLKLLFTDSNNIHGKGACLVVKSTFVLDKENRIEYCTFEGQWYSTPNSVFHKRVIMHYNISFLTIRHLFELCQ